MAGYDYAAGRSNNAVDAYRAAVRYAFACDRCREARAEGIWWIQENPDLWAAAIAGYEACCPGTAAAWSFARCLKMRQEYGDRAFIAYDGEWVEVSTLHDAVLLAAAREGGAVEFVYGTEYIVPADERRPVEEELA